MKKSGRVKAAQIIALSAFILTGAFTLPAQVRTTSAQALDLSALQLVDSNAIPAFGNFYFAQNYGIPPAPGLYAFGPPLPTDLRPDLPLYALGNGNYVIDDYGVDRAAEAAAMSRGGMMPMFSFSTDGLWLEMTGVTNGLAYLNLYNATNSVYQILTKTDLSLSNWTIENEIWPTNSTVMPFNISELARTNLFVWAMDWTGVTENSNSTPDWWFWHYFGTTALLDGDLGSQGQTLLYDYQNKLDPNSIVFSLQFTNYNVRGSPANGTLSISAGIPSFVAILVNDTNLTDAVWQPYASSNLAVPLSSGNGIYTVFVGLRGLPFDAQQTWVSTQLNFSNTPPVLTVTNPVSSTVSVPMIQLQGLVSASLSQLTYDVSNAAGIFTNFQGYWQPAFYDTNLLTFTTNSFQCYDIALTNGLNDITLHATDVAGNTATTNVSFTLDYSGDHTAPVQTLIWPTNGTSIAGSSFTAQAQVDDATATVTASINSNIVTGLVERNGTVWFNNLPLNSGTNTLSITATDAAGNTSATNLNVVQSTVSLTIDPLTSDQLNQSSITVTGTIGDSSQNVTVNGVTATVTGNNWSAANVPVSPDGTAGLKVQVGDSSNNPLAEQDVYQPQPAKVVLASYKLRFHEDMVEHLFVNGSWESGPTGTIDNIIHWSFSAGGSQYYDFDLHDIEDTPDIETATFAAGLNGLSASWEDSATAGNFEDYEFPYGTTWDINNRIETQVMIDAAGQAKAGQTTLYLVEAQVTNKATGMQVAGNELQIQGTTLTDMTHDDGSVWSAALVSAPAGVNPGVTPTPVQPNVAHNDTLNVLGQECKLAVMADEVALDPDEAVSDATFYVGAGVIFSVANLPPGARATNFEWSFEGTYFNNQSNSVPNLLFPFCSTTNYVDYSLLHQSVTTNWWISGGPNASAPATYTASVRCLLILTNATSSQLCSAQGKISMVRPLPDFHAEIRDQVRVDTNNWYFTDSRAPRPAGTNLHFGISSSPANDGIAFIYSNAPAIPGTTNAYGFYFLVQVINQFTQRYNLYSNGVCQAGYQTNDSTALDGGDPSLVSPNASTQSPDDWADSPGTPLTSANWLYESNSFTTYLMFAPSLSGSSRAVPMYKLQWSWYGSATNNPWGKRSGSASVSQASLTDEFPFWTHLITNNVNTSPSNIPPANCFPEN